MSCAMMENKTSMNDKNIKYDIFISYFSSENVDGIRFTMKRHHIQYYRDTRNIVGGDVFYNLAIAIMNSIVFFYIESHNPCHSIYTLKGGSYAISKKDA